MPMTKRSSSLGYAWQSIRGQWKSGMLGLMAYAVVLSVCCIVLGRWLSISLDQQFGQQSVVLFGADRVITSAQPIQLSSAIKQLPLQRSQSVVFHTMAYSGDQMQLIRVRATDSQFPLRGQWQHEPAQSLQAGQLWLDSSALQILGLKRGDVISIGAAKLRVAGRSLAEPTTGTQTFWLVPTAVMSLADLKATQAIGPGSRIQYIESFAGSRAALAKLDQIAKAFPTRWRYRQAQQFGSRTRDWLSNGQRLISISVAFIVLLCFYTLLIAMRGYLRSQRRLMIVARTLGASKSRERSLLFLPLLLVFSAATLLGAIAAWLIFLGATHWGPSWLHLSAQHWLNLTWAGAPTLTAWLMLEAAYQLARRQSLRELFKSTLTLRVMTLVWGLLSVLVLLGLLQSWRWFLLFGGAIVAAMLIVRLSRYLLVGLFSKLSSRYTLHLALLQLKRSGPACDSMVLGITLAMGFTAALWGAQHQLLSQWLNDLPAQTPNYFLVNLQPTSVAELKQQAQRFDVKLSIPYTIVRGRLSAINATALCQKDCSDNQPKALGRELNFTESALLADDNKVVAGQWFKPSQPPSVSLEADFAKRMHIQLGDKLTFTIYGSRIKFPVTSIRQVNWQSFHPNFFVIFSPNALADYPGMVMTSAYVPASHAGLFIRAIRKFDPGFSAIDIDRLIQSSRQLLNQLSLAIRSIAGLLVIAAVLLLNAQLGLNLFERRQQIAVLRLLGANRSQLTLALLVEFSMLGGLSALLAVGLAQGILWPLGQWLMLPAQSYGLLMLAVCICGPVIVCLAVLRFIRQLVHQHQWQRWGAFD
ncbi:ABC transporter permease [Celerinatantimonas yamalensis]|uniref:FtsX-like permease family protein n=1 Tax=Celerinatantimonas yamalensis TaxID=559956 RepID=A0ABW9G6K0_9GAMM